MVGECPKKNFLSNFLGVWPRDTITTPLVGGWVGEVGLSYDIYLLSIFILIIGHPNYYKLFLYLFERKK